MNQQRQSKYNNSTTPLANGETFTGRGEIETLPDILVTIKTDQVGILSIELSPDGENWDTVLTYDYVPTDINPPQSILTGGRFVRVKFENTSGSDQTYFRLNSYFGFFDTLRNALNTVVASNFPAIVVRPTDTKIETASGKYQNKTTWNKFGYNKDVDSGAAGEVVASFGGTFTPLLDSQADTLELSSTDAADTDGGTGLNSVVITGVDENRNGQVEVVTLNGTSAVTTSNQWLGINRIAPFLCGTGLVNAGTVTAQTTTSSTILGEMPAGETVTQQAIFYIQANHTFMWDYLSINVLKLSGASPTVTILGWVYSAVANAKILVYREKVDTDVENTVTPNFSQPFPISEKSVLWFECITDTNDTIADVRFSGVETKNV